MANKIVIDSKQKPQKRASRKANTAQRKKQSQQTAQESQKGARGHEPTGRDKDDRKCMMVRTGLRIQAICILIA